MPKDKKPKPTEEELVKRYVNRTIMNERYHGRINEKKFEGLAKTDAVNKKTWMDTDFYFSVVFQTSEQKYEFLKALKAPVDEKDRIQIINGLELAKLLNISIKTVTTKEYPTGSVDLMPLVLDNEILGE